MVGSLQDKKGLTALHLAAKTGAEELCTGIILGEVDILGYKISALWAELFKAESEKPREPTAPYARGWSWGGDGCCPACKRY